MANPSDSVAEGVHSGATGWEALVPLDWDRLRHLTNEPVPQHLKRWWFALGGTPAYLFMIQVTTGLLLTFYYHPGAEEAYASVDRITHDVSFGWFVRSIHKWSANLMIVAVMLHLLRVFFTRAYRHPRQLNWVFGVVLLLLTLGLGFTGYSLVYEQLSFWGATVATNLTESVPLLGPPLAAFLRGGPEVGSGTMTRLFVLHVGILPLLLVGALGLHLTFVRLHGVTEDRFAPPTSSPVRGLSFLPRLLACLTGLATLLALGAGLTGRMPFDFVGYTLAPGASRLAFLAIAIVLGLGTWWLWRRQIAGLLVFLAFAVLTAAKLGRDLLVHEAPRPGLWWALLLVLGSALVAALLGHRRFSDAEQEDGKPTFNFFPDHFLTEVMIGTGLLFLLTLLSLIFPAELGEMANPQVTPEHIKPEWYFYFQFRLLKLSPGLPALGLTALHVSVLLTGLLMLVLFLWPWLDRRLERLAPGKNLPVWLGVAAFLVFLTFTVWEAMVP